MYLVRIGRVWGVLGATWSDLEVCWRRLGGVLGRLGASWGVFRASWGVFRASWGVLGRLRNVSGTCLGRVVAFYKIYRKTAVTMQIMRLRSVLKSSLNHQTSFSIIKIILKHQDVS